MFSWKGEGLHPCAHFKVDENEGTSKFPLQRDIDRLGSEDDIDDYFLIIEKSKQVAALDELERYLTEYPEKS